MQKLAIFDFDSTLLAGESINLVLDNILTDNKKINQLEAIRAQGMRGEIDLASSLNQRIAFFKDLELDRLERICQHFPWTYGAPETIQQLKNKGYLTVCLSGGFRTATRRVISELGMDAYCCNTLEVNNGKLTGKISGPLMQHQSKGEVLAKIQVEFGLSPANTLVVGDGANDLSLFDFADTRVAFCAHERLVENATHVISDKDLRGVLRVRL